jgi:hypothetical protein
MKTHNHKSMQSVFFTFILAFTGLLAISGNPAMEYKGNMPEGGELTVKREGRRLFINAYIPKGITEFELRIESDRNQPVCRTSTISPHDPDSVLKKKEHAATPFEIWYPVVDLVPEQGMDAVCRFSGTPRGWYIAGKPFYRDEESLAKEITIPGDKLEYWENPLMVAKKEWEIETFYLRKTYPVLLREFRHSLKLLSEDWSGKVSIFAKAGKEMLEIASAEIPPSDIRWEAPEVEAMKGTGLSRERLIAALKLLMDDGLRRQNNNPASPMYGSLFAFYDMDARTYRGSYWTWAGTQFVNMALEAIKIPNIREAYPPEQIIAAMDRLGKNLLRYQVREEGFPSKGSFLVIWSHRHNRFTKWVGTSDSGVIIRWGIIPLFLATGDSTYLEAAQYWCDEQAKILDTVRILPHYYRYDEDRFNDFNNDETGWDPDGHSALYAVTGEVKVRETARSFMDKFLKVYPQEDDTWVRGHNWVTGENLTPEDKARRFGWIMEGLMAMNRMYPDTIYLEYAKQIGSHLLKHQLPDGSWSFQLDLDPVRWGVAEKGTALWSMHFYHLFKATGEKRYLEAARKALNWCLDNQYTGPDPEAIGGVPGRSPASMVGIRRFYDATCSYTTGFFGMAILEELSLPAGAFMP